MKEKGTDTDVFSDFFWLTFGIENKFLFLHYAMFPPVNNIIAFLASPQECRKRSRCYLFIFVGLQISLGALIVCHNNEWVGGYFGHLRNLSSLGRKT